MAKLNKYIWLIDTIRRRGRITRRELSRLWEDNRIDDGRPLNRRTLYNYLKAIEELFHITISVDLSTFEYYIDNSDVHSSSVTDWLLNTQAVNDALAGARDISDRIFLENVPSARDHLGTIIEAMRHNQRIKFDYHNYTRSRPSRGVLYEPYFIKIFKQRWYAVGRSVADDKIKTYALDRMRDVLLEPDTFAVPEWFDADNYFRDAFGIVVTSNEPRRIAIRTDHRNANYLRDLPLHHSQEEVVHDGFSIFYYRMRITDDLVAELLSMGSRIIVLEPPELRNMLTMQYKAAIELYETDSEKRKPRRQTSDNKRHNDLI